MAVTIGPHPFTEKIMRLSYVYRLPRIRFAPSEKVYRLSPKVIKRENATLIYNRRDTPREIVTTQVSTECMPFRLTI